MAKELPDNAVKCKAIGAYFGSAETETALYAVAMELGCAPVGDFNNTFRRRTRNFKTIAHQQRAGAHLEACLGHQARHRMRREEGIHDRKRSQVLLPEIAINDLQIGLPQAREPGPQPGQGRVFDAEELAVRARLRQAAQQTSRSATQVNDATGFGGQQLQQRRSCGRIRQVQRHPALIRAPVHQQKQDENCQIPARRQSQSIRQHHCRQKAAMDDQPPLR